VTAPRRRAAAFTLLEVVLASLIGTMAVLACIGMFAAVDGHSVLGRRRFDEALEIERTREAVSRAMQLLIMSDTPMPVVLPSGDENRRRQDRAARNADDPPPREEPTEPPRLDLSYDPTLDGLIMVDSEGNRARPQRLEVVLRTPPIFVTEAPEAPVERRRLSARERREEQAQREADEEALLGFEEEDITVAPGLRGVFELTFEPGPVPYEPGDGPEGTFSLWWRPFVAGSGPADDAAWAGTAHEEQIGRALLLSNLRYCRWQVFVKGEKQDEIKAVWADELPAYVTLTVETTLGTWHSWLFEVAWSVGKEPGSETRTRIGNDATGTQDDPAGGRSAETEGAQPLDPDAVKQPSTRPRSPTSPGGRSGSPGRRSAERPLGRGGS